MDFKELFLVIYHSLIIFILLVVLARVIGKKFLAQMTYFDFVTAITIGTIGGAYVTSVAKGYYVLISPVVLTLFVYLTSYLSMKSIPARKLIEGEPLIIIQNGKIFENNMRKVRYTEDDLLIQLREKGVFDLHEVEFAVLEPHGQLSVLKKASYMPVTPKNLGVSTEYKGLPSEIIRDGKIVQQNLEQNHLTHEWLYNELAAQKVHRVEDVFLATLSTNGKLFIDLNRDNLSYVQKVEDDKSFF